MYKQEIKISDKILSIETGTMAKQANGSVTVRYGETIVLVTATSNIDAQSDSYKISGTAGQNVVGLSSGSEAVTIYSIGDQS